MECLNPKLLAEIRCGQYCEICDRYSRYPLEPHHLWRKGMGGGSQVDMPENLLGACRYCHDKAHYGQLPRGLLVAIRAHLSGTTPEEITRRVKKVRDAPKGSNIQELLA